MLLLSSCHLCFAEPEDTFAGLELVTGQNLVVIELIILEDQELSLRAFGT